MEEQKAEQQEEKAEPGSNTSDEMSTRSDGKLPRCAACAAQGPKLLCCSRCKLVHYCSRECQKQHWKAHKRVCKPPPPRAPDGGAVSSLGEAELRAYIEGKGLSHEVLMLQPARTVDGSLSLSLSLSPHPRN